MARSRFILTAILLSLLMACAGLSVSTDYNSSYDFSAVASYAWLEPVHRQVIDPLVDNDLMNQRLHRAIDEQLTAKGLVLAASAEQADILVSYHLSARERLSINSFHSHFGYYPCYGCYGYYGGGHGSHVDVRQYTAGSFLVDLVDPQKRELVWRGVTERRLQGMATPEQRQSFVSETIRAILDRLPVNVAPAG